MSGVSLELYAGNLEDYAARAKRTVAYHHFLDNENEDLVYSPPEDSGVQDRLRKIFKVSFPLSNGSPICQFFLQAGGLNVLRSGVGMDAVLSAFADYKLQPEEFYPPKRHAQVDTPSLDKRVAEIWSIYEDIAQHLDNTDAITETDEMGEEEWGLLKSSFCFGTYLMNLGTDTCLRDLQYIIHGRPSENPNNRRYRSMVKTHILDGKPSGSPELDVICKGVRSSIKYSFMPLEVQPVDYVSKVLRGAYVGLAATWEGRHAPEQFSPIDFAPLMGKPILDASTEGGDWRLATPSRQNES